MGSLGIHLPLGHLVLIASSLPLGLIDPSLAIWYPGFSLTMVRIVKVYTCHPQIGSEFEPNIRTKPFTNVGS